MLGNHHTSATGYQGRGSRNVNCAGPIATGTRGVDEPIDISCHHGRRFAHGLGTPRDFLDSLAFHAQRY